MNAYTTRGQSRMQPRDVATLLRASTGSYVAAASLAALERQRGWQAEAEVEGLLKQHGLAPKSAALRVALLRQTLGTVLIRAGEWLAGVPRSAVLPERASVAGTLGTAG